MLTNNSQVHQTITSRVRDDRHDGWEFVCPTCGYRARYTPGARPGRQQLEVLSIGDAQVRHVSHRAPVTLTALPPVNLAEDDDDERWLTPELRQQMEELLKDVDMGDW